MPDLPYFGEGTPFETEADWRAAWDYVIRPGQLDFPINPAAPTMPDLEITVVEHHPTVYVASHAGHGERGRTDVEAVGRLILLHPEIFHIKAIKQ